MGCVNESLPPGLVPILTLGVVFGLVFGLALQ